ncbi:MAG: transcription antitermination factor NusB [Thermoleophilaceae bacterium]|jgi:transcription antitermination protein NusB
MRRADQRRAAVVALYQRDVTRRPIDELVGREAKVFTRELVEGVEARQPDLDDLIARHAEGWTLDRIAPLERSILRVGLFELLYRDDVPDEVAIDQAIETAKELCGAGAPAFINGILGAAHRERAASA